MFQIQKFTHSIFLQTVLYLNFVLIKESTICYGKIIINQQKENNDKGYLQPYHFYIADIVDNCCHRNIAEF